MIEAMPVPSVRLKTSITGHLDFHASKRWPQLEEITISWCGGYGYVTGHLPSDEQLPLCRLRYSARTPTGASASTSPIRAPGLNPRRINAVQH
jgi:hypothetical protein